MDEHQTEPVESTEPDGINVGMVAMIGAFLAVSLLVLVIFLQAWYYHADESERVAKIEPEESPATPYGAMVKQHQQVLATGDSLPDLKGKIHHGLPIETAMKMIVDNPKYLAQPLSAGN